MDDPHGLNPKFDFEVNFPGFRDRAGQLADASVTLQNAGLDGRFLTGSFLPYEFQGSGVLAPFGTNDVGLRVKRIEGGLSRSNDSQGFDVRMTGSLHAPFLFPADTCLPPNFTVRLVDSSGFQGRIEGVRFCAPMQFGPLSLSFTSGFIDFALNAGSQEVRVGGQVTARLNAANFSQSSATGSVEVDIVSGRVLQSTIAFRNIQWSYPRNSPFFSFSVPEATISPTGIVMSGSGSFGAGQTTVEVNFTNVGVGFERGEINAGELEITAGFSIELGISPVRWSVVDKASLSAQDSNRALLVMTG